MPIGGACRLSGGTLERSREAANMLSSKKKQHLKGACGELCQWQPDRRHKSSMNKTENRELIDAEPVYPGVGRLYGLFRRV